MPRENRDASSSPERRIDDTRRRRGSRDGEHDAYRHRSSGDRRRKAEDAWSRDQRPHDHRRRSERHSSPHDSYDRHSYASTYRDRTRYRSHSRQRSRERRAADSPPPAKRRRRSYSPSRSPPRRPRAPLPSQDDSFRGHGNSDKTVAGSTAATAPEKQKPNYKPTGLLAKEANTVAGTTTVLKYHEPPEARKPSPKDQWRVYVFKKKDLLETIHLHTRSVWLIGRDPTVTDLLLEHPSISKQHAVVQFRHITRTNEFGDKSSKVKPYLIDLESANGTKLNGEKVEPSRYVELVDGDVVTFGDSEREYVVMLPPADA